jgi:hypothetical protein
MIVLLLAVSAEGATEPAVTSASSSQLEFGPTGVVDQDRFSFVANHAWKGAMEQSNWWWKIQFSKPRDIGAILQVQGDHEFVSQNAPRSYLWQASLDGQLWNDLSPTRIVEERRLFRLHRLPARQRVCFLRLQITAVEGKFPTVREVEFYSNPREKVSFPDWIIAVNTTHDPRLPGEGKDFISLAKSCRGWDKSKAQQIWLGSFDEDFCAAEPRPLCAFLSGNFKDWCQIEREPWRGTEQFLKHETLPLWASCGGAQGLAILATTGVDKAWDCPHCRDPQNPKIPVYTHIGHTGTRSCGDYSSCVFERGPRTVRVLRRDPVFNGLSNEFQIMESHCGQIEWAPAGWEIIATGGPGTLTKVQCLKVLNYPIYAAQFHIEMPGTPETSRQIMGNFLRLAKSWGGYIPRRGLPQDFN